jgi:hypothetical protein
MWRRLSPAWRWAVLVAAGALLLAVLNVWWVAQYRHGFPLNVDENGYTAIGIVDWLGFETGGIHGWWEAIQLQTPNAPLLPALSSVLMIAVTPGVMEGFGTLIAIGVALVMFSYGIGARLAGPRLGALGALAVATSEGIFLFAREYIFALPAAAALSAAVYALIGSDAMRRRWWSVGVGVAIGLMLLSRTMGVAFVPGLAVAAVLLILIRGRGEYPGRFLNFGLATLAGFLVSITWYWRNLQPVYEYLTNYGYGSQAQYYGAEHSALSWPRFKAVAATMVGSDLLAPLAVVLLAAFVALAVVVVRRVADAEDRRAAALRILGSDAFAVAIVFVSGFTALMSSRNGGNGFTFPLAMLLPPLAVVALRYYRGAIVPAAVAVALIGVVNVVSTSDLSEGLSEKRLVELPPLGEVPWVNGEPHSLGALRVQVPGPADRFTEAERGWTEIDGKLADLFTSPIGPGGIPPGLVAFGSRNRLISTNSLDLAGLLRHRVDIPCIQIDAEPTDSVADYVKQLSSPEFGEPTALVTMSSEKQDFPPTVTQSKLETAARRVDFHRLREFTAPDGRKVRTWVKRDSLPPSRAAPPGSPRG